MNRFGIKRKDTGEFFLGFGVDNAPQFGNGKPVWAADTQEQARMQAYLLSRFEVVGVDQPVSVAYNIAKTA